MPKGRVIERLSSLAQVMVFVLFLGLFLFTRFAFCLPEVNLVFSSALSLGCTLKKKKWCNLFVSLGFFFFFWLLLCLPVFHTVSLQGSKNIAICFLTAFMLENISLTVMFGRQFGWLSFKKILKSWNISNIKIQTYIKGILLPWKKLVLF